MYVFQLFPLFMIILKVIIFLMGKGREGCLIGFLGDKIIIICTVNNNIIVQQ